MRPQSIVLFERIVILSIFIGLIDMVLFGAVLDTTTGIVVVAASVLIFLLLVWLVARKGSNIARWVYVLLVAAGLAYAATDLPAVFGDFNAGSVIAIVQLLLSIFSIVLLFRADARAWFERR